MKLEVIFIKTKTTYIHSKKKRGGGSKKTKFLEQSIKRECKNAGTFAKRIKEELAMRGSTQNSYTREGGMMQTITGLGNTRTYRYLEQEQS